MAVLCRGQLFGDEEILRKKLDQRQSLARVVTESADIYVIEKDVNFKLIAKIILIESCTLVMLIVLKLKK